MSSNLLPYCRLGARSPLLTLAVADNNPIHPYNVARLLLTYGKEGPEPAGPGQGIGEGKSSALHRTTAVAAWKTDTVLLAYRCNPSISAS